MDIGKYIKLNRERLGLSQEQVAEACGVSKSAVSRWESGDIGAMRADRISALAKVLQVNPYNLVPKCSFTPASIPTDIIDSISRLNPAGMDALRAVLVGLASNPAYTQPQKEERPV